MYITINHLSNQRYNINSIHIHLHLAISERGNWKHMFLTRGFQRVRFFYFMNYERKVLNLEELKYLLEFTPIFFLCVQKRENLLKLNWNRRCLYKRWFWREPGIIGYGNFGNNSFNGKMRNTHLTNDIEGKLQPQSVDWVGFGMIWLPQNGRKPCTLLCVCIARIHYDYTINFYAISLQPF